MNRCSQYQIEHKLPYPFPPNKVLVSTIKSVLPLLLPGVTLQLTLLVPFCTCCSSPTTSPCYVDTMCMSFHNNVLIVANVFVANVFVVVRIIFSCVIFITFALDLLLVYFVCVCACYSWTSALSVVLDVFGSEFFAVSFGILSSALSWLALVAIFGGSDWLASTLVTSSPVSEALPTTVGVSRSCK